MPDCTPLRVFITTLCSDPGFTTEVENFLNNDVGLNEPPNLFRNAGPLDEEMYRIQGSPESQAVDLFRDGFDTSKARLAIESWMKLGEDKFESEALDDMQSSVQWYFVKGLNNPPVNIYTDVIKVLEVVKLCEALDSMYNKDEKKVIRAVLAGSLEEKMKDCENFLRPHLEGQISRMLGNDTP